MAKVAIVTGANRGVGLGVCVSAEHLPLLPHLVYGCLPASCKLTAACLSEYHSFLREYVSKLVICKSQWLGIAKYTCCCVVHHHVCVALLHFSVYLQLVKELLERGWHVVAACRQCSDELQEVADKSKSIKVLPGAHSASAHLLPITPG